MRRNVRRLLWLCSAALCILGALLCLWSAPAAHGDAVPQPEILVDNLDTPWAIDFLPNGSMIFTERQGTVRIYTNGSVRSAGRVDAHADGESGLMGIAVDPDFSRNRYVYLYYTRDENGSMGSNRLSRFTLGSALGNETVLIDGIPSGRYHNGGRLKFGPDGMLYLTTGDAGYPPLARNTSSLAGKVLRIAKDGSVPADNPFKNLVYSYGHRNPEGLAWRPGTGELYESEHGFVAHDEINIIRRGADYGWPDQCDGAGVQPLRCYGNVTLAPAGIAFSGDELYVACLRGSELRVLSLNSGGNTTEVTREGELLSGMGRLRDAVVHGGYVYVAISNKDGRGVPQPGDDKILRMPLGNASDPPSSAAGTPARRRQLGILLMVIGISFVAIGILQPRPELGQAGHAAARVPGAAARRARSGRGK